MSSDEQIRARALEIGKSYVDELRKESANLDLEQSRLLYSKMAGKLEDELTDYLKKKGVDGCSYTTIGEKVFNMFRDESSRIIEAKKP